MHMVGKGKNKQKVRSPPKSTLGKIWHFLWYEDSFQSWIASIIVAFVVIKFVFYPLVGLALGTSLPIVAVVSESMDHGFTKTSYVNVGRCTEYYSMCDNQVLSKPKGFTKSSESFWNNCGLWYENQNISQEEFSTFPFKRGFSKGDIIVLRGKKLENIDVGDVIVFDSSMTAKEDVGPSGIAAVSVKHPVIHRVVAISEENEKLVFSTKGDHNAEQISVWYLDETTIPEDAVIGTAWGRIPLVGWVKLIFVELLNNDGC